MKRIAALLAAALLTMTVSLSAAAEPDDNDETVVAASQEIEDNQPEGSSADEELPAESTDGDADGNAEGSTDGDAEGSTDGDADEASTDGAAEENTEGSQETSEKSTADNAASSKGAESTVSKASQTPEKPEAKYTSYHIEEGYMNVSIPADMYVITRDTDKDDPVLSANRTTKAEVTKSFQENDIYLRAVTKDFSCVVNVTVSETPDTQSIGNLAALSEDSRRSVADKLLESDIYTSYAQNMYNGVPFLTFAISYQNDNTRIHGWQQYTIVNGRNVRITYQTAADIKNDPNRQMFDQVMESIQFERLEESVEPQKGVTFNMSDIDIRYVYIAVASFIGMVALMVMIIVGIRYKRAKRKFLQEQQAAKNKPDDKGRKSAPSADDTAVQDIFSDTARKNQPLKPEDKPFMPPPKPMTYEDTISAQPKIRSSVIVPRKSSPAETPDNGEVVFAGGRKKGFEEAEQTAVSEDKAPEADEQQDSLSAYEKLFGKPSDTGEATKTPPAAMDSGIAGILGLSGDADGTKDDDKETLSFFDEKAEKPAQMNDEAVSDASDTAVSDSTQTAGTSSPADSDKDTDAKDKKPAADTPTETAPAQSTDKAAAVAAVAVSTAAVQKMADKEKKPTEAVKKSETSEVTSMYQSHPNSRRHQTSGQERPQSTEISEFERASGINVERAPAPQRPVVPMQTPFTKIPRLESVSAEAYNQQYEEMKKTMPKNRAYAQRFSTESGTPSAEESDSQAPEEEQPVPPPAPPPPPSRPAPAVRPSPSARTSSTFRRPERPRKEPPRTQSRPQPQQDSSNDAFSYYTGYDQPEGSQTSPAAEEVQPRKKDSVGSRLKKSIGKIFMPDPPYDEE